MTLLTDLPPLARGLADALWQTTAILALGLGAARLAGRRPARAHAIAVATMLAAVVAPLATIAARAAGWGLIAPPPVGSATPLGAASWTAPAPDLAGGPDPVAVAAAIAAAGWGAATACLLVRLLAGVLAARRAVRRAEPLPPSGVERLAALERRFELPALPPVRVHPSIPGAAAWPGGGGCLLLAPATIALDDEDLAAVLAHETAHLRRRDHLAGLLAEAVVALLPWQPLAWRARRTEHALREFVCDDWAVRAAGSPLRFARLLCTLAGEVRSLAGGSGGPGSRPEAGAGAPGPTPAAAVPAEADAATRLIPAMAAGDVRRRVDRLLAAAGDPAPPEGASRRPAPGDDAAVRGRPPHAPRRRGLADAPPPVAGRRFLAALAAVAVIAVVVVAGLQIRARTAAPAPALPANAAGAGSAWTVAQVRDETPADPDASPIRVSRSPLDLGVADEGGAVSGPFAIANAGRRAITILAISPGCGCTTIDGFEGPVVLEPGSSVRMQVTMTVPTDPGRTKSKRIRIVAEDLEPVFVPVVSHSTPAPRATAGAGGGSAAPATPAASAATTT